LIPTTGQRDSVDIVLRSSFYGCIDKILAELKHRFTDNEPLYRAVTSFSSNCDHFLSQDRLQPLVDLGIVMPSAEELKVARSFVLQEIESQRIHDNFGTATLKLLFDNRKAFPNVYEMSAAVATLGCSTAMYESSFSTLSRIDRPNRRSKSQERKGNLTLLAFEQTRTESLNIESVLRKFAEKTFTIILIPKVILNFYRPTVMGHTVHDKV
jgi:hypothetical protein